MIAVPVKGTFVLTPTGFDGLFNTYADRIRQVVATCPFSHGKPVTASFGVASLPDDEATNSEDLFRAADEALYAAKRAGKNQVMAAGREGRVS